MHLRHLLLAATALILGTSAAFAADDNFVVTTGPDGGPVFPGVMLPRYETAPEIAWRKSPDGQAWLTTQRDAPASPPPTGVVLHGGIRAGRWNRDVVGASFERDAVAQVLIPMVQNITSTGNARVYMSVDSTTERTTVNSVLAGAGVNMSKVKLSSAPPTEFGCAIMALATSTRAMYVRSSTTRTIAQPPPKRQHLPGRFCYVQETQTVRHRPRPRPIGVTAYDGLDRGFATRLINNENQSKTEPTILGIWDGYQNLDVTLFTPFSTSVDTTQHIDMRVQVIADDKVMVSDWAIDPNPSANPSTDGI